MKNAKKYTFQVTLLADVPNKFVKDATTTCVQIETARNRMISKYPLNKGFFFELKSVNQ